MKKLSITAAIIVGFVSVTKCSERESALKASLNMVYELSTSNVTDLKSKKALLAKLRDQKSKTIFIESRLLTDTDKKALVPLFGLIKNLDAILSTVSSLDDIKNTQDKLREWVLQASKELNIPLTAESKPLASTSIAACLATTSKEPSQKPAEEKPRSKEVDQIIQKQTEALHRIDGDYKKISDAIDKVMSSPTRANIKDINPYDLFNADEISDFIQDFTHDIRQYPGIRQALKTDANKDQIAKLEENDKKLKDFQKNLNLLQSIHISEKLTNIVFQLNNLKQAINTHTDTDGVISQLEALYSKLSKELDKRWPNIEELISSLK